MFNCSRIYDPETNEWHKFNDDELKISADSIIIYSQSKHINRIQKELIKLTPEEQMKFGSKKKVPQPVTQATQDYHTKKNGKKKTGKLTPSHKFQGKFTKIYPHYLVLHIILAIVSCEAALYLNVDYYNSPGSNAKSAEQISSQNSSAGPSKNAKSAKRISSQNSSAGPSQNSAAGPSKKKKDVQMKKLYSQDYHNLDPPFDNSEILEEPLHGQIPQLDSIGEHKVSEEPGEESGEELGEEPGEPSIPKVHNSTIEEPSKVIPWKKTDFLTKHQVKTLNKKGELEWNSHQGLYKIPIDYEFKQKAGEYFFEVKPKKNTPYIYFWRNWDRETYEKKRLKMTKKNDFLCEDKYKFRKRLQKDPTAFIAVPVRSKISQRLRDSFPHTLPPLLEIIQWRTISDDRPHDDRVLEDDNNEKWFEIDSNEEFCPEQGILNYLPHMSKL